MQLEVKKTPLDGLRMHDFRESYLNDPGWFDTQTSVDLVRGLFGVSSPEIGPVDITTRIVATVPITETKEFRSILINKTITGDLWEFTTDFGCSVMFQKIPHKDGVNSLRLVLKCGDIMRRPLVEYTAGECKFFEPSEREETAEGENMALKFNTSKESEVKDEPPKDISDTQPEGVQPPAAQEPVPAQENLSSVPDGSDAEAPGDGAGDAGSAVPSRELSPESDVVDEDDDDWSLGGDDAPATQDETPPTETQWPKRILPNFSILIDGDANVRECNYLLDVIQKLLTNNEVEDAVNLTELLANTPLEGKRYLECTCERTGPESLTVWTKAVPSKLVDKLNENPSLINTIWARAEERCGGMKDGEDVDKHVEHIGRVIAKALKAKFIHAVLTRPDYLISYEIERFTALIDSPIYAALRPEASTEAVTSTLKEEVAKVDAQAIAHGETTLKEVAKVNEAMAEQEGTTEVEATPMPEQIKCEPLCVKVTFPGLTTKQVDEITVKIHNLFEPLPMEERVGLDCQLNVIQNVLWDVLGEEAKSVEYTHMYRDGDKTFTIDQIIQEPATEQRAETVEQVMADKGIQPVEEVINNEKKETDKMIIVRINCKEIVDQPDIDKMRAVIENYFGADADPNTAKPGDAALSDLVSQALDYECHVETIKMGEEYVVTVPTEDDEPEQPAPREPEAPTEPVEVDEEKMAAEMMSEKDTTPVRVDPNWIDIEDPAIRQQCVQILFPDVLEPSFMHLMHFLKDHHRKVGTPSFLATKETIPTETTIVYDNLTFSIVKMKDGRFWRMFIAHTDFALRDHDWISTNHIKGRWFQLGRDIHDNNQRSFPRNGFRY